MNGWGNSNSNSPGSPEAVSVLIAGPLRITPVWSQAFQIDSRFRVNAVSNDVQDLTLKLGMSPEVLLLHGEVFHGPQELLAFLTRIQTPTYLVLPPLEDGTFLETLRTLASVRGLFVGDTNLNDLAARIAGDTAAIRSRAPALERSVWNANAQSSGLSGLLVIAVWNRCGGSGKTTLTAALGQSAAQRGLKSLAVGLGSPDALPVILGLKPTPNIVNWLTRPTIDDGLPSSIQKVGGLDVIAGLQDTLRERDLVRNPEEAESINKLVSAAAASRYAVILLDAPVSGAAMNAISAANTLVLVAQPTVADAVATAEAYRVVIKKLSGGHSIGAGNVVVVLNRVRSGMLSPDEFHQMGTSLVKAHGLTAFPPIVSIIPDTLSVTTEANAGRPPLGASSDFARPVNKLGDTLFGGKRVEAGSAEKKGLTMFGFRIGG